jgi:ferredoxin-thioredoxin reductase catalytic chain
MEGKAMHTETLIRIDEVDRLYAQLDREAEATGYHLNPDCDATWKLVEKLMINENRYGYRVCPSRHATGDRQSDEDIICPCIYRDADIADWGACYCRLYVMQKVVAGQRELRPVPERRCISWQVARIEQV